MSLIQESKGIRFLSEQFSLNWKQPNHNASVSLSILRGMRGKAISYLLKRESRNRRVASWTKSESSEQSLSSKPSWHSRWPLHLWRLNFKHALRSFPNCVKQPKQGQAEIISKTFFSVLCYLFLCEASLDEAGELYRNGLKYASQVLWIWDEKIAFSCLMQVGERNFFTSYSRNLRSIL